MVWRRTHSREGIRDLLSAVEQQAAKALRLAERAQRDIGRGRFASFLDFRKQVEEVRALLTLTEGRVKDVEDSKQSDLRAEFERMDLFLMGVMAKTTRRCFAVLRDDQALPIGARELFEPELRVIEQTRDRLNRPHYEGRVPPEVLEDLAATAELIRRIIARAPSLPDFSDSPSAPKPVKRLRTLSRAIRN
ncbi:hypothetical protein [Azospirillum doebereinerae]|uniref:Uncharacterized protein n=1 Tax=Azospirillum doebereinerae TaxID=92933 RepID=A0A3S0V522_9PROT|nr:hypothetical protein [Azospirillum doebereinerae]RUQ67584.1 hypothetical protein EJ913_20410 [Azospirillum doebereinerae]